MKEKMDYLEKWGKDVDEAVKLALVDLKLTEDEVNITVLEEPTKGFLGLGAKLAKVRVEKKTADKKKGDREHRARREKNLRESEKKDGGHAERSFKREEKFSVSEKAKDLVPVTDGNAAEAFVRKLMEKMGLDVNVHAFENSEYMYIEIDGKDSRIVIGKRGQTLDAVQYLTNLASGRNSAEYTRVVVDVEGYRARREKTLEELAEKLARKVEDTGKNVRLEPMNPYERRVIHATLQSNDSVTTRSEGEEPFRRVVIEKNGETVF